MAEIQPFIRENAQIWQELINHCEEARRNLQNIIRELKDTRIPLMTSVVTVNVTNDLRYAKAYISVMGDEETKKKFRRA